MGSNPVLILTHNCLELTKKCVESVRKQDAPTSTIIVDGASTDGTVEWLPCNTDRGVLLDFNKGVSYGWNKGLGILFDEIGYDHTLVINNDTVLPSNFYSELLSYNVPFVTGRSTESMLEISSMVQNERQPLVGGPDFSAFLIRREAWEKIGPFDERMKLYAGDNDYHVRAHRAGVPLLRANLPFYHERSSTLKKAPPAERREIELQADRDREVFKSIYGCMPWEPGYAELFK